MPEVDPLYYDTETCGYHGPIVLIQYAIGDGPVELYCPWISTVWETLEVIEMIVNHRGGVIGFNLAFDHFHLCQMYTTLQLIKDKDMTLQSCLVEYALAEPEARHGDCLKPVKSFDIMLHARKGEYQSTMNRKAVRIRRIPTALAWELAAKLTECIPIKDVYFAKSSNPKERWKVYDILDEDNEVIREFKDVALGFRPSSALKALAEDILDISKATRFNEVEISNNYRPVEQGWAPFALAPYKNKKGERVQPSPTDWHDKWPQMISEHITHWGYNSLARKYAEDDVVYTRELYKYFGSQPLGDDDSELACMVGAVRWRGYAIDVEKIQGLKNIASKTIKDSEINFNSHEVCRNYLSKDMDATQIMTMMDNGKLCTKGIILETIAKWGDDTICDDCGGLSCEKCEDGIISKEPGSHPCAKKATEILDFRHAKKEIENYDKLLDAGRFHASFKVIGALSSRMSGSDGLNAQGINRKKEVRECFPLADDSLVLCGGDFDGFEISIADAVYNDPDLRADLLTGKSIHALFGQYLFPGKSYEDIMATKGLGGALDLYGRSKNGVFALLYGGESFTLATRVGIPEEIGQQASDRFSTRYKQWGRERELIFNMFCSMRQPGGIGTRVEWHEPADFIESMFGFRRYFTLENTICETLFKLANNPPKAWKKINFKVVRRDRDQTAFGAVQSALYGAAFQIQASNMRAAGNHVIQSSGATMTKSLQRKIWDVQPSGIGVWVVQPMNIHDEVMAPTHPDYIETVSNVVETFIEDHLEKVPLLGIDWDSHYKNWASK